MPTDEDVIMGDQVERTAEQPSSQPRRTDHDWELYYLPTAHVAPSQPHPSQNLVALYRLEKITASVRRTDPTTGEKINKIRKSYEGKVKQLHIAGVNKAVSTPKEFINGGILDWPEHEWHNQKVRENPVQKGLRPDLLAKLDKALHMTPGRLPEKESEKWKKLIGTDEPPKGKIMPEAVKKPGAPPHAQSAMPLPTHNGVQPARPARPGAKRRYVESTFKGYGEGFADEVDAPSLSEEESRDMNPLKKRRRKDLPVNSPLGQGTSYNVGLMAGGARR